MKTKHSAWISDAPIVNKIVRLRHDSLTPRQSRNRSLAVQAG